MLSRPRPWRPVHQGRRSSKPLAIRQPPSCKSRGVSGLQITQGSRGCDSGSKWGHPRGATLRPRRRSGTNFLRILEAPPGFEPGMEVLQFGAALYLVGWPRLLVLRASRFSWCLGVTGPKFGPTFSHPRVRHQPAPTGWAFAIGPDRTPAGPKRRHPRPRSCRRRRWTAGRCRRQDSMVRPAPPACPRSRSVHCGGNHGRRILAANFLIHSSADQVDGSSGYFRSQSSLLNCNRPCGENRGRAPRAHGACERLLFLASEVHTSHSERDLAVRMVGRSAIA